jgi:glutaredoxin
MKTHAQENGLTATNRAARKATLYRMVTDEHICPFGLKARDLLEREGFEVDDHKLKSRAETDAFEQRHQVKTTPQILIDGARIGGYDALREYFGRSVPDADKTSYQPVVAVFAMTALMALSTSWALTGELLNQRSAQWFISFSMCVLAILKLRDLHSFSNMFLGYDLLARHWVPYAYVYPFGEAIAGVLMIAGVWVWLSAPIAFVIGSIGAVSVVKAVYVDKRTLKCACVGGDSNVPLGFISLTENLMMVAMAIWTIVKLTN